MVLADPEGSILAHYVETGEITNEVGSWTVEGIGEDFLPPVLDLGRVRRAYSVSDREAFAVAREVLNKEGILGGSSSGTLIAAALRWAREQTSPKTVVTFVCDSGNKYLSKMYNDFWMIDNGYLETPHRGDLTDLIARKHAERQTVTVKPTTTLAQAYRQMKLYDISQLPVLDGDTLVGLLDEEDLLVHVYRSGGFEGSVADVMTRNVRVVDAGQELTSVLAILERGMVAPVVKDGRFQGLITKIDVLNHLRLHPEKSST
jgi:cystathionine beta-synthase